MYKTKYGQNILDIMLQNKGTIDGLVEFYKDIESLNEPFFDLREVSIVKENNEITKFLDSKDRVVLTGEIEEVLPPPVFTFKTALIGDGVNDFVLTDSSIETRNFPSDSFTLITWFRKPNAILSGLEEQLYWNGNNSFAINDFRVEFDSTLNDELTITFFWKGRNFSSGITIVHSFIPGTTWHHLAADVRVSGGVDQITLYLDGVQVAQTTGVGQDWGVFYSTSPNILRAPQASPKYTNAIIDQFSLIEQFDIASNISAIYNSGDGVDVFSEFPLAQYALYYDFNEADDDPNGNGGGGDNTAITEPSAVDRTGNGYTGTLFNFAKTGSTSNWIDH